MTDGLTLNAYAAHPEPATLKLERLLPGPIERVWAYLTESDLRRRWLAAGDMQSAPGSSFEFVWRNDELTPTRRAPCGRVGRAPARMPRPGIPPAAQARDQLGRERRGQLRAGASR